MRETEVYIENSGSFLNPIFRGAAVKRLVGSFFVISAICLRLWTASAGEALAAGSGDNNPAVLKADQTLQSALKKGNDKAIGALLDEQFTWTNETGQTRPRAQFLRDSRTHAQNSDIEYTDMEARDYGQLAIVRGLGAHRGQTDIFFVRIWVKRPAGWRLFAQQNTGVLPKGALSQQLPPAGNVGTDAPGCENPCRSVPFVSKTADQQEVVKAYQAVETAVTEHDAATWAYHVAEEFKGIGRRYTGKLDTKEERVAQIKQTGSGPVILPKMVSLQVFNFGDAAIMIADHHASGEQPFRVIRAWVKRDGRWQLFHRQETTIEHPPDAAAR
jgi:ketosteroid isomerase-like protein